VFELVHHALRARVADQVEAAPAVLASAAGTSQPAQAPSPPAVAERRAAVSDASERPLRLVSNDLPLRMSQSALGLGFRREVAEAQPQPAQSESANGAGPRSAAAPRYADLRVLGQLFTGFIALEGEDGLILIDQHAAHERVTFEKLRAELRAGAIRVQAMLTPAAIEVNPARVAQVTAAMPELHAMGFELELFGPAAILIKGAPAVFGAEGGAKLLSDMIDAMGEQGFRGGRERLEEHLKTLACHGSVRSGRVLRVPEISELLTELDRTEFKTNCPHGRPVHIEFRRGAIERMFRR